MIFASPEVNKRVYDEMGIKNLDQSLWPNRWAGYMLPAKQMMISHTS